MRTLKFIVDGQIIVRDPNCNFDNLVPGSEGYLEAEFKFSKDWTDCVKVVAFWSKDKECPPQELRADRTCIIPAEALRGRSFKVQVIGKKKDFKILTNKVEVQQDGGRE